MIQRATFLDALIRFRDKDLIKVITGIRRCGKSTLLGLFKEYLLQNGVFEAQIIEINFEDADYDFISNYMELHDFVKSKLISHQMNYIILDEIQHIDAWEKAVDSLYIKKNCDVYITGSNAYLLSGELSTLISGRYVEVKMFPLSFAEYMSAFPENTSPERKYNDYIVNSSFPYTLELSKKKDIRSYLEGIYHSIILKDVVKRKKIADVAMLESVIKFAFDNIGNLLSIKRIADMGRILENIVLLELLRRGYEVGIGKIVNAEVDFVATNENGTEYYQVALTVREKATLDRELRSLDSIPDHNSKFLLTMDMEPIGDYKGIKKIYALDWLLS